MKRHLFICVATTICFLVSVTFVVCFSNRPREERPISNLDLEIMSNSLFSCGRIEFSDGRRVRFREDSYELLGSLIRSLRPITSSKTGSHLCPNLILSYDSAGEPTTIGVWFHGSELRFSLGKYIYSGGTIE